MLIDFGFGCDDRAMNHAMNRALSGDGKFDYQREAIAAMRMALATGGFERIKWVRLAQAWQDLGRDRNGNAGSDRPLTTVRVVPPQQD